MEGKCIVRALTEVRLVIESSGLCIEWFLIGNGSEVKDVGYQRLCEHLYKLSSCLWVSDRTATACPRRIKTSMIGSAIPFP